MPCSLPTRFSRPCSAFSALRRLCAGALLALISLAAPGFSHAAASLDGAAAQPEAAASTPAGAGKTAAPDLLAGAYYPEPDFLDAPPSLGRGFSTKSAVLTIFYNANSNGELHPCPT
ncbi:hypothetical protein LJC59_04580 [Desulfovibrio sp. OttesenSCG-928-A18]|nr:hypothetical protein [Desulfovibrio sp. OttesenSCG-928-A18]